MTTKQFKHKRSGRIITLATEAGFLHCAGSPHWEAA